MPKIITKSVFQVNCNGPEGRALTSFGRKRRSTDLGQKEDINLREMFRVYETRDDIPEEGE